MAAIVRKKWKQATVGFMMWILAIYTYISSFMQNRQTVSDLAGLKEKELSTSTISPREKQINKQVPMW